METQEFISSFDNDDSNDNCFSKPGLDIRENLLKVQVVWEF